MRYIKKHDTHLKYLIHTYNLFLVILVHPVSSKLNIKIELQKLTDLYY